jgi:transcriptional regulator with XRE-family HTH domain
VSSFTAILRSKKLAHALEDPTLATNNVIAKLVKARRGRLGISLLDLADASGVSLSTLDRLEHRRGGCSAVDLWRIAQALDVSISDLCATVPAAPALAPPRSFRTEDPSRPGQCPDDAPASPGARLRPAKQAH